MEIIFLKQAQKFIHKADKPLKEKIRLEILKIAKEPKIGKMLKGELRDFLSHHFSFKAVQYRIAYRILDNLIIVSIATRENFYRDLIS